MAKSVDRSRHCDTVLEAILGNFTSTETFDDVFALGILQNKSRKYVRRDNNTKCRRSVNECLTENCFGNVC
jgi:hypothetical protein